MNRCEALAALVDLMERDGGQLVMSTGRDDSGGWSLGMTWGREADDSDMFGAAAYASAPTLEGALVNLVEQSGAVR